VPPKYDHSDAARLGLLDPTAAITAADLTRGLPRLESLAGKRIGLLDNSKTHCAALLARIGESLVREHGAAEFVARTKLIYSRIAARELIDDLGGRCDAVITAIGD